MARRSTTNVKVGASLISQTFTDIPIRVGLLLRSTRGRTVRGNLTAGCDGPGSKSGTNQCSTL